METALNKAAEAVGAAISVPPRGVGGPRPGPDDTRP